MINIPSKRIAISTGMPDNVNETINKEVTGKK